MKSLFYYSHRETHKIGKEKILLVKRKKCMEEVYDTRGEILQIFYIQIN